MVRDEAEEELMRRYVRDGDRAAFEELFRRYAPRLRGFFRRGGVSEAQTHDLLQKTFLNVHRARNDFDLSRAFRPWVFAIATNVRREHHRRARRKPEAQLDLERHPEPSVAPDTSTVRDRLVRRALHELPEGQREVILLHWFEGLTFPEVGQVVGASTSAVKVRAHRGYERLRGLLGGEG